MTLSQDLNDIRDNIIARLKVITETPKPSYAIDGQEVKWQEHYDSLMNSLQTVVDQINIADGPYEFRMKAYT